MPQGPNDPLLSGYHRFRQDRWPEARWADLEAQLGVAKQDGPEAGPGTPVHVERRTSPRRRTVRSSYMR